MSADVLEILRQFSFLSSVLAGFAITAAIELVGLGKRGRVSSLAIAMFLISGVLSAAETCVFVFVLTSVTGAAGWTRPSDEWIAIFLGGIGVLPLGALILFLAGTALVGWLRSRMMGIVTTVSSALGLLMIVYVMESMSLY